jgi:hypothetical protein
MMKTTRSMRRTKMKDSNAEDPNKVSVAQLQGVANDIPKSNISTSFSKYRSNLNKGGSPFDVGAWIKKHGIPMSKQGLWGKNDEGYSWELQECPWNGHTDGSAFIVQFNNGAISAGCHHHSCQGYGWSNLRSLYEPNYASKIGASQIHEFPVDALPESIRRFVKETAISAGCPVDFVGVAALVALGAAIGNTYSVAIKKDWTESSLLYAAIVAEPGSKKSPALTKVAAPVWKKQSELTSSYKVQKRQYDVDKDRRDRRNRGSEDSEEEVSDAPVEPIPGRVIVDDTTVEAVLPILQQNSRGLLCAKDELSAFVNSMNQYKNGKGSDKQVYLSMWNQSPAMVDRKSNKEPILVEKPFVGLVGAIQPDVLKGIRQASNDGFMERFLFSYPEWLTEYFTVEEVSDEARISYETVFEALYGIEVRTNSEDSPDPRVISMSLDAREKFAQYYNSLEDEMSHPDCPTYMKGANRKLQGYTARIALILSVVKQAEKSGSLDQHVLMAGNFTVNADEVHSAIQLVEYFKSHAAKALETLVQKDQQVSNQKNASKEDDLASSLKKFLESEGGAWEGQTAELYKILTSLGAQGLPGGEAYFGRTIRSIASESTWLNLDQGHSGKKHIVKLSHLSNDVASDSSGIQSEDSTSNSNEVDKHDQEISDAVAKWSNNNPGTVNTISVYDLVSELFYFGYLDFLPEESEVEDALKQLNAAA